MRTFSFLWGAFARIQRFVSKFGSADREVKRTIRPIVEPLEDKIAPANLFYYWNPPDANNLYAGVANNWTDGANERYVDAPGEWSNLIFDNRTNRDCVFNFNVNNVPNANQVYSSIRTFAGYAGQITLQRSVVFDGIDESDPEQSALNWSQINNARIVGTQLAPATKTSMTFNGSPIFLESARLIDTVAFVNSSENDLWISQGNLDWKDSLFANYGNVVWNGVNRITFESTDFTNFGRVEITNQSSLVKAGNGLSVFSNNRSGTVVKSGNNSTLFALPFFNGGYLSVSGGATLGLADLSVQNEASAETVLTNGTLDVTTYYVRAGGLFGNGATIRGNLSMTAAPGADLNLPRYIFPGTLNSPGNLSITGNLTMTDTTRLFINIAANGAIANLTVGGTVTFGNARIIVNRNVGYAPAGGTGLNFFSATASAGNIRTFVRGNPWANGNLGFVVMMDRIPLAQNFGQTRIDVKATLWNQGGAANANPGNPAIFGVFDNDPDFNGPIWVFDVDGNANNVGQAIATANDNSFMALEDGSIDFVAAVDFVGEDEIGYSVTDGTTVKDATLTVYVPEDDPDGEEAHYAVDHDGELDDDPIADSDGLLGKVHNVDIENAEITEVDGDEENVGVSTGTTQGGSVTVNTDGSFYYTAPENFVGEDAFVVTVSDGQATKTLTITIHVTNTFAVEAEYSTLRDQSLAVDDESGLLSWAGDVDGDSLTISKVAGLANNVGVAVETSEGGTITIQEDGSLVYDPLETFVGLDTVSFTVSDGDSESTVTLILNVVKVLAHDGETSTLHDNGGDAPGGLWGSGLLSLAEDANDDVLTVVAIDGNDEAIGEEVVTVMGGTLTVESDGTFVYDPPPNWAGDDWFVFTVADEYENESTAFFVIHVNNAPPEAYDAEYSTGENETLTAPGIQWPSGLLGHAYDADYDNLIIVAINGEDENVSEETATTEGGTVTVEEDGSWVYVPPLNWTGDDTFTFTVWDGVAFATATVTIHVG